MKEQKSDLRGPGENQPVKAYDPQEGEPDKWYARFRRYCELGPSRSLLQCYQMVMAERDALASLKAGKNGRKALQHSSGRKKTAPKRRHTPATWRQYAREYDWDGRATAYDAEERQRAAKRVEETLLKVSCDVEEVRIFYLNLMRGWIKSHDGKMVPVTDIYQRRMAAKALQNWAGMTQTLLQEDQGEEEGNEVEIREIRAHEPEIPDTEQSA